MLSHKTDNAVIMDSDRSEDLLEKLNKVLNGFLYRGNKVIRDDVYLEMMLTHLTGKNGEDYSEILKSQSLFEWIKNSHCHLNTEQQNPQIYAFTLRVLALLIQNEWQFMNLMETELCSSMNQVIRTNSKLQIPSVKLAHVQVLCAMLKHSIGTLWLMNTKSWRNVIEYCMENQTIYVVRESQAFITDFIYKAASVLNDKDLCMEIITTILAPLHEAVIIQDSTVCVDSSDLQRKVLPCIDVMCHIMDHCIRSEVKTCIPLQLTKTTKFKVTLWRLTDMTKDQMFLKNILRALVLLNFVEFVDKLSDNAATSTTYAQNQFGLNFFNHMKICILHRSALALLAMAKLYHSLWTTLGARAPEEIQLENNKIKFENQIIIMQLTPILFCIHHQRAKVADSELFDTYIMKLFDISTDHTLRVCYGFRDLLMQNKSIVPDIAAKSIQGILAMKNQLHRDRAVYVFQALSYTLKEFAFEFTADVNQMNTDKLIEMPNLLSAILTGLHALVKEYRITWKESIEAVCLLNFMLQLLNKPNLSTRLAVQALQLTQLAVEHFLAPNLALLVENLKGSGMESLGPTVMKRLHDSSWEVRDSTLELVTAMSSISIFKFPAFQQHILENGLCPVVVHLAKNDSEAFVRASALNSLCPMVNVKVIWEQCLSSMDLMSHLLCVLRTDSEGIVRKEAVLLVCEIYKNHKISNHQYDLLFPTLAHAAINDLYWEVKINALYFWQVVIMRQLKHNGVIDGAFPAVTFSKEQKKIVTLTQKEIMTRLNKILDELSTRGALGVLLECLKDDCDLEVVKVAGSIVTKVNKFLERYNYQEEMKELNRPFVEMPVILPNADTNFAELDMHQTRLAASRSGSSTPTTPTNRMESDQIIESIVSLDDINLLVNAYENQMQVDNTNQKASTSTHIGDEQYFKAFTDIKPMEYLHRINQIDLESAIEQRNEWMKKNDSFGSLLDDIMFSLEIADVNSADCY